LIQVKEWQVSIGRNASQLPTGITMAREQTLVHRLRDVPLFRSLASDQVAALAAATLRHCQAHETVYEQEQAASTCFVVLAGTVQFTVMLGRQRAITGVAAADEPFGLEALGKRAARHETATATRASELLEIDRKPLEDLLLDNPRFQLDLLETVIAQLQEKSVHAVRVGHYNAEQRIAAYLMDHCADRASSSDPIKAPSQADLASYLGLTPETFCRKVGKFRRLGWIEGTGNDCVIKQHDSLQRLLGR
jgi:CRP/FNR family transcriptional regulator